MVGNTRVGGSAFGEPQELAESRFLFPKGQNVPVSVEDSRSWKLSFSLSLFSAINEVGEYRSGKSSRGDVSEMSEEPGSEKVVGSKKFESPDQGNMSAEGLKPDSRGIERVGFSDAKKVVSRARYIFSSDTPY